MKKKYFFIVYNDKRMNKDIFHYIKECKDFKLLLKKQISWH